MHNAKVHFLLSDFWREVGLQSKYDMPHCSDINQQQFIGINPVALKYREPGRRYHGVEDCSQDFSHFFKPGEGMVIEPEHSRIYTTACAYSKNADQPAHLHSLIRVLPVHFEKVSIFVTARKVPREGCTDLQADLSLHWVHI